MTKKTECACADCVRACRTNPGWPTPDEAQKLVREWMVLVKMDETELEECY